MAKAAPKNSDKVYHSKGGSARAPKAVNGRRQLGVKQGYHISKTGAVVRNKGKRA